mmetsp:Transcript_21962/g.65783  ORF Transcript_21962/g.65783 Transcript_21962/m.65783 type:complete len:265 (+) Transcript_21962:3535-4329(+)
MHGSKTSAWRARASEASSTPRLPPSCSRVGALESREHRARRVETACALRWERDEVLASHPPLQVRRRSSACAPGFVRRLGRRVAAAATSTWAIQCAVRHVESGFCLVIWPRWQVVPCACLTCGCRREALTCCPQQDAASRGMTSAAWPWPPVAAVERPSPRFGVFVLLCDREWLPQPLPGPSRPQQPDDDLGARGSAFATQQRPASPICGTWAWGVSPLLTCGASPSLRPRGRRHHLQVLMPSTFGASSEASGDSHGYVGGVGC